MIERMTERMTSKEYLSQAFRLDQFIDSKLRQVQSYRELATKTTGMITGAPRSDSPDLQPMASFVAKIVDAETEINDMIDKLVDLKREIGRRIEAVEDQEQRLLLELRYLCYQSWDQIAASMHYSTRWIHSIHLRALDSVDKVLREGGVDA